MRTIRIVSLLLACLMPCSAAADDPDRTAGSWNGRFWKKIPEVQRLYFIIGYSHAMMTAEAVKQCEGVGDEWMPQGFNYGELVEMVDRFYVEPENSSIPVRIALRILRSKASGTQQSQIDELIRIARKWAYEVSAQ